MCKIIYTFVRLNPNHSNLHVNRKATSIIPCKYDATHSITSIFRS